MALYIVYDYDGVNSTPVYGVFTSLEKAVAACKEIVEDMVCDCLAEDPKESGLNKEYDEDWLRGNCLRSLSIQVLSYGADKIHYNSTIELPEEYM